MQAVRTDVPKYPMKGIVLVDTLERRINAGEEFKAYITPLKRGDVVEIWGCQYYKDPKTGEIYMTQLWAQIDRDGFIWAAMEYEGRVMIDGRCGE